jgi:cysteine desulfuration protein SufE
MPKIDEILDDFALLDDWEDRYRYVIELGRMLEPLPEESRTDANKVRGCASQVWLETRVDHVAGEPTLSFRGDSDAHIVRGLIAILIALFSGLSARKIVSTDPQPIFARIGLREHLTPQRSNGLVSMVGRIKADAEATLAAA